MKFRKAICLLLSMALIFGVGMTGTRATKTEDVSQPSGTVASSKCEDCGQTQSHSPACPRAVYPNAVGDKVWIRSGSEVYKQMSAEDGWTLLGNYEVQIVSVTTAIDGTVWLEFEFTSLGVGELLLRSYRYVRAENVDTVQPGSTSAESHDCNCGENAPENLADHDDSCPRKQYILSLIKKENGNYKTAAQIYADWSGYDVTTRTDILNMVEAYVTTEYETLCELVRANQTEWVVGGVTYITPKNVQIAETSAEKKNQLLNRFALGENRNPYFVDISGTDGEEATIIASGILTTNAHKNVLVLHLLDTADAVREAISAGGVAWSYFTVDDSTAFAKEVAAAKDATGEDNRVYYETLSADVAADGTITFQTDSFSTFMYIVTFEYEGYTCELSGGGTMYLSDLMKALKLDYSAGQVTGVSFSDSTLLTAEKNQDDWIITSQKSFHTEEYMTLTFSDNTSVVVKLTDPTVKYYIKPNDAWTAEATATVSITRANANGTYKSDVLVNSTVFTPENIADYADDKSSTTDLILYVKPGMAIRFASGIGFGNGNWNINKSNQGTYKNNNLEWIWDSNINYLYISEDITTSTYQDYTVTANGKSCQIRIYIICQPSKGEFTLVRDTVENDSEYDVKKIPVTLYDYDGAKWNQYWNTQNASYWYAFSGVVEGVKTQEGVTLPWTGGNLPNSGNLSQGVFEKDLVNGLPVFTSTAQTDLFGKTTNSEMGKTVYNDVAFEFIYETKSGFYTYSSNLNHAQYNSKTNTIELYDQSLGAQIGQSDNSAAGFYPFADIHGSVPNWGSSGAQWKDHLTDTYKTYHGQYSMQPVTTSDAKSKMNMHYGIQIEADFYMPVGRLSQVNGEELVYEFTGDDDLWVFVDGKLVLDLGGAHTPISGTINFTQKTVTVDKYHPVTANGNTYTEVSVTNHGKTTFTFEKLGITVEEDQMHTLQVFYLERWCGESNCRMRFNLPIAPSNAVYVGKEVTNQDGEDLTVTPDVDYTFGIFTAADDDDTVNATDFTPYANQKYTIQGTNITGFTDANGQFKLKPGQTAVFENIDRFTEVYVIEYDPNDGYIYTEHLVSVNSGAAMPYTLGEKTETKIVQRIASMSFKFTNRIKTQPLTFTKEVVNGLYGLIDKNQKFTFTLQFTKNILETGEGAIKANDGKTLTNGKTFELAHGESITLPRVPVNMTFDFGEQNPDPTNNSFDAPKYELTIVRCSGTPNAFGTYGWTVVGDAANKIKVINQQRFDLTIKKEGISEIDHKTGENPDEQQSTLYKVVGKAGGTTVYEGTVAICGNSSVTIKGLPVGTYTITEVTDWSWRYEPEGGAEQKPDIQVKTEVSYTNKRTKPLWLSGDNDCKNLWDDKNNKFVVVKKQESDD